MAAAAIGSQVGGFRFELGFKGLRGFEGRLPGGTFLDLEETVESVDKVLSQVVELVLHDLSEEEVPVRSKPGSACGKGESGRLQSWA